MSTKLDRCVAVITGAGSGIGRATARALAVEGARVVLAGRTEASLRETARRLQEDGAIDAAAIMYRVCDVSQLDDVQQLVGSAMERFGRIDVLVNNAGLNIPHRALSELGADDWRTHIDVMLNGAYWCVREILPLMRAQRGGTMIHIGSNAARRPSVLPGAAYTAAKAGLAGLSAVINAEEGINGVRSAVIVLGDTNTPLLDLRPHPPSQEARARAVQPEDVAACVCLIATLPPRANVEELVLLPVG